MPKNVGDLGKLIVAKGFKKLPKVQEIAQSGHTERDTERKDKERQRNNKLACENIRIANRQFFSHVLVASKSVCVCVIVYWCIVCLSVGTLYVGACESEILPIFTQ